MKLVMLSFLNLTEYFNTVDIGMAPIPKLSVLQASNFYSACTLNAKWSKKNFNDRCSCAGFSLVGDWRDPLMSSIAPL